VAKEDPDVEEPLKVVDIRQNSTTANWATDFSLIGLPGMQSAALMNTDPVVPWLPPPKILWTRFAMDGFSVTVQFEDWTVSGVTKIDTDGDTLPDDADWSTQHVGDRNCSDMFNGSTADKVGYMPNTICRWNLSQVTLYFPTVRTMYLHEELVLRNDTILRYLPFSGQWSYTTYGSTFIDYPYPILDPVTIVRHYAQNANSVLAPVIHMQMTGPGSLSASASAPVKLCERAWMNSIESYHHGGLPRWTWTLQDMYCESIGGYVFEPNPNMRAAVLAQLIKHGAFRGLRTAPNSWSFGERSWSQAAPISSS